MKNYQGYIVKIVYYDHEGNPTTALVEKPNSDPMSFLPLDSKRINVQKFLQELEAQSPDLFRLFQEAFDVLAGNAPQEQGGQGLMQRFGNLAQGAMMPPEGAGPMSGGPPIEEPVAGGPPMMPMQ